VCVCVFTIYNVNLLGALNLVDLLNNISLPLILVRLLPIGSHPFHFNRQQDQNDQNQLALKELAIMYTNLVSSIFISSCDLNLLKSILNICSE
jgi:hypothetical protein